MSSATVHVPTGIQLLLVEDNPVSAQAVQDILTGGRPRFSVRHVATLSDAEEWLRTAGAEVVLLDIGLPDSSGLHTLERVRACAPEVPIVVLTGVEFEEMALAALAAGADDYLFKGEFDRPLLVRSVRYSMERRQILNDLEQTHHRRTLRRELDTLAGVVQRQRRAHVRGTALMEHDNDRFRELLAEYRKLVAEELDGDGADHVTALVEALVAADASSSDVLDLHASHLRVLAETATAAEVERRIENGRVLIIELLGRLAVAWAASDER